MEKESNGRIITTGCLMHCRRYFAIAFFVHDISSMSKEEILELPETKVLFLIREIYIEPESRTIVTQNLISLPDWSAAP